MVDRKREEEHSVCREREREKINRRRKVRQRVTICTRPIQPKKNICMYICKWPQSVTIFQSIAECANKVEVGVHSSTLSLYGNIVAMNEVRNRVGSSNTFLKYQQQSYWKKIPCGGILLAHCWNLMKQPRLPGIFLLHPLKLNIIYWLLMGTSI